MILPYNVIVTMVLAVVAPFLPLMALFSEKRRATLLPRLGIFTGIKKQRTAPKRIWIHALSVGEVRSATPLVKALNRQDREIVFTASTQTGYNTARALFLDGDAPLVDQLAYFPFDFFGSVNRVCSRIAPDMVVIVETDLWPNFLWQMKYRKIPVFLVNARLSQRSFKGYHRLRLFLGPLFSLFSRILVQTDLDARRFEALGVDKERIMRCGNIKFDQEPPQVTPERISAFRERLGHGGGHRIFLAGSTHAGEEDLLVDLFSRLKPRYPNFAMVVVPRDPKRAEQVRGLFSAKGVESRLFSELDTLDGTRVTDVVVVDTMGVLAWLYAVCDIAFIGGSLVDFGGHNPLEAAAFAKPVLFGSHMADFALVARLMTESDGAFMVADLAELVGKTQQLLDDPILAEKTGKLAAGVFYENQGAVERTVSLIGGRDRG
ncbi:MAG: 3-deoxy-D-manno-octulosonic acid transferase [Desulfobacterium sp.]|nr:3-deoxy-D-manno-octulosonic acid transferase [Desulfobacterium sp.]